MAKNNRLETRYRDFGRVECPELCIVGGVLENISISGCKVRFCAPVMLNIDDDYELKVRFSRLGQTPLILLCRPAWFSEEDNSTEIGFEILRSADSARLEEYVSHLGKEKETVNSVYFTDTEDESCLFL